ncbi:unnamed protein product [Sphagnum balticum]
MIRRKKQIHLNSTRFRQHKKEEVEEEEEDVHTPQTIGARKCFPRYWSSKEQSCVTTAATFERNLANRTTGCTSRKRKDTGPRKTPNRSTYVKKKIRALLPVREPGGISISSLEKRQSASSSDRAPKDYMNGSADDALRDSIFTSHLPHTGLPTTIRAQRFMSPANFDSECARTTHSVLECVKTRKFGF